MGAKFSNSNRISLRINGNNFLDMVDLLEKLRDYIILQHKMKFHGMCNSVKDMYTDDIISMDECIDLEEFLLDNIPEYAYPWDYWWTDGEKPPRLLWIDEQLGILKQLKVDLK